MEVTKPSNVNIPEIIALTKPKPQKYPNNDLFLNVVSRINSGSSELCLKEGGDK